jgi:hypothetical protein
MTLLSRKYWWCVLSVVALFGWPQPQARAILIAYDNFNSYTAGTTISTAAELNGGSGWAQPWAASSTTTNVTRTIENPVFADLGNAAMITITSNQNIVNVVSRQISTPQTGTFYVGMMMRTSVANPTTNDFLQFYFNSTPTSSDSAGYGGGVNRGASPGVAGSYYVRRGNNADPPSPAGHTVSTNILHNYDQDTVLIFKLAKILGGETDTYDIVSLFVDQATEGTPDAELAGTDGSANADLASIDMFHIRYSGSSGSSPSQVVSLMFDDLVFADSYSDAYNFATTGVNPAGLDGDFNLDNRVDAADYIIWRKGLGTTHMPDEYNTWRQHFGESMGSGSLGGAAVPEPSTAAYSIAGCLLAGVGFARRRWKIA